MERQDWFSPTYVPIVCVCACVCVCVRTHECMCMCACTHLMLLTVIVNTDVFLFGVSLTLVTDNLFFPDYAAIFLHCCISPFVICCVFCKLHFVYMYTMCACMHVCVCMHAYLHTCLEPKWSLALYLLYFH